MNNRNSEIIICRGIKIEKNYENVLSYSESDMITLCRNNSIYESDNLSILGSRGNSIDLGISYSICMYANYMAFKNPSYGDKWFFAFITDVEYLSDSACRIYYEIDVWETWYPSFELNTAFIEREHVADDTVGKHTIPEGLELGEYILNATTEGNITFTSGNYIVLGLSEMPFPIAIPSGDRVYNGVFSGLLYVAFETGGDAEHFITLMQEYITQDIISTAFIVPVSLLSDVTFTSVTFDTDKTVKFAYVPYSADEVTMGTPFANKYTTLDGYTPVNNKLKVFPYQYLCIDNNAGSSHIYHYEDWVGTVDNKCNFSLMGAVSPGCAIRLIPTNYKGQSYVENEGLDAPKLPTCGWTNDAYTNWLTQNALNIPLSIGENVLKFTAGGVTGNASSMVSGFTGIASTLTQIYEKSLTPLTAKGGVNQGDLTYARRLCFNIYHYSIRKEYCTIIDSYFSRFGYKVNEVKTPNLNSRTKFNFIKVGGNDDLVHGDIPASSLEEINNICRKGVTIFHDYNSLGDYTVSNTIVTPTTVTPTT